MNRTTHILWQRRIIYFVPGAGYVLLVASIILTAFLALPREYPFNATIREIIGWLYAGSTALLAGLIFLVATLESQEKVRLKRGFYMVYSGVFMLLIVHIAATVCAILYSAWFITPLATLQAFTVASALYIVWMIFVFLTMFISPKWRDSTTRRFLINKIEYSYAVYIALSKKQKKKQKGINTILMEYGIEYNSGLHQDSYYTPIASGASGYVVPRNSHLRQLGEEAWNILSKQNYFHKLGEMVCRILSKWKWSHQLGRRVCGILSKWKWLYQLGIRVCRILSKRKWLHKLWEMVCRILRISSTPPQKGKEEIKAYHCITFDERIATGTPLLFIPHTTEDAKTIQQKLSCLLAKKVHCNTEPKFTNTTYIGTMQSFQELLLQEQSIDVFQDYARILQELLFRYIENDYFEAHDEGNHSILTWYHRIAETLVQSKKAEQAKWIQEMLNLYHKPVHYLCDQAKLPQKLLGSFLQELEYQYFQAGRSNQVQTELQQQIMHEYDTLLASLCKRDQTMAKNEFGRDGVKAIADQIILFHQATILKSVYNRSDITTFKNTANSFVKPSQSYGDDFLETAFRSITPIITYSSSLRNDLWTVEKTYREYCSFQKMKTLFLYAQYIFYTNKLSMTDPNTGNNPYLAFLIDGGLPTSRVEFIYLYGKLFDDNSAILPGHSILWEEWDWNESPSRIDSWGMSETSLFSGVFGFFCWYNLHKCEHAPLLDEGQISQLFSVSFRRQAGDLAQQFQKLIDDDNKNTLTEQQQIAVENTIEFLQSLSKSYDAERHNHIVQSELNAERITEAKNAFREAYRMNDTLFLEALQSLQIITPESSPDPTESVLWNIRGLREKIRYIAPIGDGVEYSYSWLQQDYTRYARIYIHKKIALIWEQWKKGTPQVSHAKFFDALSGLNDDYIVVCNSISPTYIAHVWDRFFTEQPFPYRFIASPPIPEADNNNGTAFHEQIATIEFQHNDTKHKIPVAYFSKIYGVSPSTVTFIILHKSSMGTFQQYSFTQGLNDYLWVHNHAVRFKITDLGRDEKLMQEIIENPPNFISQGAAENDSLTPKERLQEYVHLIITDAFEFTYSTPADASLCGYIECDFNSVWRQ